MRLHADRKRDLHMIESLGLPVADGAVGEERGVATPAGIEERLLAANIEIALLLPGEACVRQILGRRAASDGHIELLAVVSVHRARDKNFRSLRPGAAGTVRGS